MTQMGDYAFIHGNAAYTPNQTDVPVNVVEEHNRTIEAQELAEWATAPQQACVYVVKRGDGYWAETWLGTKLSTGPITHKTFASNIARNMSSVSFKATNGANYFGRYGSDWAQFCRVRKSKH